MSAAPPKIASTNARFAVVLLAVTGVGVAAVVYCFNPVKYHLYPVCEFHQLTGLNCPGCGATRALYALLHGDFSTALRDNVMLVLGLAAAALRGGWFALNRFRGQPNGDFFPARLIIPSLVVMIAFGVLRNLPAFAFLSP
jgi:hypothetical protein